MNCYVYSLGDNLYLNITNQCPCSCEFCIRQTASGVGTADSLWLDHQPTADEVIEQLKQVDLADYHEVVFCGYGEPTCALDVLRDVCRYIRENSKLYIRLNTNGLGDLVNKREIASELTGLLDGVSVSMNTPTAEEYEALCHPTFGLPSYKAMLRFASSCKKQNLDTCFSIVDVIPKEEQKKCQQQADHYAIPLRIRHCET